MPLNNPGASTAPLSSPAQDSPSISGSSAPVTYARCLVVQLRDVNAELDKTDEAEPLWGEAPESPETTMIRKLDAATIQRLVAALPHPFREVIVLREINDLSYREIAEVVGAPVGTVMSRLARARSVLRTAWLAEGRLT